MLKKLQFGGHVLFVITLLALLLAGCGGGEGGDSGPADPAFLGPYQVGVTELTFQRPSSTTGEPRFLKTIIWYPAVDDARFQPDEPVLKGVLDAEFADIDAPAPVIIFSHGSGGMPYQSTFYTRQLASHGFVVVAPPHPGNTTIECFPCREWDALVDSYLNRPDDVIFALDSVLALNEGTASLFYGALDAERLGITGHSFGGLTTMMLASGESRFDAALAMAPAGGEQIPVDSTSIRIPTMIMGGGLDSATPLEIQQGYFGSVPAQTPHYLLVVPLAGHLNFADACLPGLDSCGEEAIDINRGHELINTYGVAFFKTYVAGETGYEGYLDPAAAQANSDIELKAAVP